MFFCGMNVTYSQQKPTKILYCIWSCLRPAFQSCCSLCSAEHCVTACYLAWLVSLLRLPMTIIKALLSFLIRFCASRTDGAIITKYYHYFSDIKMSFLYFVCVLTDKTSYTMSSPNVFLRFSFKCLTISVLVISVVSQ